MFSSKWFRCSQIWFWLISIPIIWVFVLFFIFIYGYYFQQKAIDIDLSDFNCKYNELSSRLANISTEINALMLQNGQLLRHLNDLNDMRRRNEKHFVYHNYLISKQDMTQTSQHLNNPSANYEHSRRRLHQNLNELWYFLSDKLDAQHIQLFNDYRYNMLFDLQVLTRRDKRWRTEKLVFLSELLENKIKLLQNPSDCKSAKKLVCDLNKSCGFACQLHHMSYCLLSAMAMNRTLIMDSVGWHTSDRNDNVWNRLFRPLSDNCLHASDANRTSWRRIEDLDAYQVIDFPIIDYILPRPSYLPLVIPTQISDLLMQTHGEPFVWFIGQLLKYVMRHSIQINAYINKFKKRIRFRHPIVGLHVRRTDKIGFEADYHSIGKYMPYIDDFYNKLDIENQRINSNKKVERIIYLATDEPNVWIKEIKEYQNKGYIFIGDVNHSKSAIPSERYGYTSIRNAIVDITLLSQTDHIVCTFSSQICRLSYELMQSQHTFLDRSQAFNSLDDVYYFGGQIFHGKLALVSHKARNQKEISFNNGDLLGIANDMHNGYNFGENIRSKKSGLYPRFKVTDFIESKPFAIFG